MAKKSPTYSLEEADKILNDYIDKSAERLRKRLKTAWKKQKQTGLFSYDKATA